jgi:uncharacterized repeat protein (TIGR04138 family)
MPPSADEPVHEKSLQQVVEELSMYPVEAFRFVEEGLSYTVNQRDERLKQQQQPEQQSPPPAGEPVTRHISGQQLCEGLRDYALIQWGLMARAVLQRWNITNTFDFGRIVFALIDAGRMQKTDDDTIDDFRNVYDFKTAFERDYRIEQK